MLLPIKRTHREDSMKNHLQLLFCASLIGCAEDYTSDIDAKTSIGFSKSLEERILALEGSLESTSTELATVKEDHAALLATLDAQLDEVDTLANDNADALNTFAALIDEMSANVGQIEDNTLAIYDHED